MAHVVPCKICKNFTRVMSGQPPLCISCKGKRFKVRCTTCRRTTLAYPTESNPKCDVCKGRFCTKCQQLSPVAMLTLDQVCLSCAKKSPSAVYTCDRCKGLFEIEIDDTLPRSAPGYVLCWHCVLQDSGEISFS